MRRAFRSTLAAAFARALPPPPCSDCRTCPPPEPPGACPPDDEDVAELHPEVVRHDLSEGGLMPLSRGTRPSDRGHRARPLHPNCPALPPRGASFHIDADPDSDNSSACRDALLRLPQRCVIPKLQHLVQRPLVRAGVVRLPGDGPVRELVRPDEVPAPELRRVPAGNTSARIHQALDQEGSLRPARAPVRGRRRGRREDSRHFEGAARNDVRPRERPEVVPGRCARGWHQVRPRAGRASAHEGP